MIRILTLFRIVPDYDKVLSEDWKDVEHLDTEFVKSIFDAFDEGAIEGALRLKDELVEAGKEVKCVAAGAGIYSSDLLSSLYAAGYDEVYFWEGENSKDDALADAVTPFIKKENFDIIFTGNQSGPFAYRMDGPMLSYNLNFPWFMDVTEVHLCNEDLAVTFENESEYITVKQELPCICSFGNAVSPVLRMFSLKSRMDAKNKEVFKSKLPKVRIKKNDLYFTVTEKQKTCEMLKKDDEELLNFIKKSCKEGRCAK